MTACEWCTDEKGILFDASHDEHKARSKVQLQYNQPLSDAGTIFRLYPRAEGFRFRGILNAFAYVLWTEAGGM